jgi:autotransporter-associated beta strand protein
MKPRPSRKPIRFSRVFLAGFLLAAANSAQAQTTFFWDADGDATLDTGGSGLWDKASSLWRSDSSTGTLSQWPNTDPAADYAQLEGTAGTLTLDSGSENIHINRIIFSSTGYEIAGPVSGTATLNLSGTSPRITTDASVSATISAPISGSTGFAKTGAGTLTLAGTNSYTGATTVSSNDTNGGIVNVSGDQSAANGGWSIFGTSVVNFQGGSTITVAAGKNITLANSAGAHSLNVAGTVTTDTTSSLVVRGRSTLNLDSGADWTQNGPLTIQPLNTAYGATMNVRSGASFTYNGSSDITLARSTGANSSGASLNLNAGTFTTARGFSNTAAGTGSGNTRLTFSNGGTLKLSADIASLIIEGGSTFGVIANAGGGIIDTNGFSTSIDVPISGVGGLTKAGTGTLTLSGINSYAGDTTVTGGTLSLGADNISNDASTVTLADSGVLLLTYEGTDTVDKLFIGATQQAAGVYGHSSTGATNGGLGVGALDDRFANGTGTLTVTSNPGGPFDTFMAAYPGLTGNDALPEADPDGDGLSNLAEFIMGGTAPDSGIAANRPVQAAINGYLTISILVPSGATFAGSPSPSATVQGVQVAVGGSLDLTTFDRTVEKTALDPSLPSAPTGYEWHTFRLGEPISSQSRGFLRASFTNP